MLFIFLLISAAQPQLVKQRLYRSTCTIYFILKNNYVLQIIRLEYIFHGLSLTKIALFHIPEVTCQYCFEVSFFHMEVMKRE